MTRQDKCPYCGSYTISRSFTADNPGAECYCNDCEKYWTEIDTGAKEPVIPEGRHDWYPHDAEFIESVRAELLSLRSDNKALSEQNTQLSDGFNDAQQEINRLKENVRISTVTACLKCGLGHKIGSMHEFVCAGCLAKELETQRQVANIKWKSDSKAMKVVDAAVGMVRKFEPNIAGPEWLRLHKAVLDFQAANVDAPSDTPEASEIPEGQTDWEEVQRTYSVDIGTNRVFDVKVSVASDGEVTEDRWKRAVRDALTHFLLDHSDATPEPKYDWINTFERQPKHGQVCLLRDVSGPPRKALWDNSGHWHVMGKAYEPQFMTDWPEWKPFDASEPEPNDDGWVKVSDRLPEPYTRVLLHSNNHANYVGWLRNGELKRWSLMGVKEAYALSDITHWRELPEAPK